MNTAMNDTGNLLIIDNDGAIATRIRDLLGLVDYRFYRAENASQAMQLMNARHYDCVFIDADMGAVALSMLRRFYDSDLGLTKSPVVMLAAITNEAMMLDTFRQGARDYLLKDNLNAATLCIAIAKAREMHDLKRSQKLAEHELSHTRKMEAIGQLTSGVAHDFNNLLTVVIGNVHLLKRRFERGWEHVNPEDVKAKVAAIETVSSRGAELVRRLMVFTRQTDLVQSRADVSVLLRETMGLLSHTLDGAIEIETDFADNLWPVMLDTGEFQNMIINFAVNARDAMGGCGQLMLEAENIVLDEAYTLRHPDMEAGRYVMIAISDTGCGMKPEVAARIFEPFFTTKPAGEGTGLGMSMAYGFIRQSGGHIHVYSEIGHGTVFRIYLPVIASEIVQLPAPIVAPQGRETILVVEDEDDMRITTSAMLQRLGYKTIQAQDGHVALEILKSDHDHIDLVFTDLMMPGAMQGQDLAQQVHEYFPDVKILFTSGYSERSIWRGHDAMPGELLTKPYRRETLAVKVRKVLDQKEAAAHV